MNRNNYVLWFLVLVIIILPSCGGEKKELRPDVNNQLKETYSIVKKSDIESNIKIFYPQITTNNDEIEISKINKIIETEARKVLKYYDNSFGGLDLDIDYKIQREDDKILSIQFSGIGYLDGAAHPNNLFFTTNIDIQKATRLRLNDLIDINQEFIAKIRSGEFSMVQENEKIKQEILSNFNLYTTEELSDSFKNADSLDNIGTDNQSDIYSYLIEDSIGISVSVSHASGDHAEFLIN